MLRTQADTVHVSEFGVKFVAYGKFSDVRFDTEKISWECIDAMVIKGKYSKDKCSNCDDMELELDEECPDCGRVA